MSCPPWPPGPSTEPSGVDPGVVGDGERSAGPDDRDIRSQAWDCHQESTVTNLREAGDDMESAIV